MNTICLSFVLGLVDADHFPNEIFLLAFNLQTDFDILLPKHSKIAQFIVLNRPSIVLDELKSVDFSSSHHIGLGSTGY